MIKDYEDTSKKARYELSNTLADNWVVISNKLLRSRSLLSTPFQKKLWFAAVSEIPRINEKNEVKLSKKELCELIGYNNPQALRNDFIKIMNKSYFEFGDDDEWAAGRIISFVRADRKNVYVKFEEYYLPLVQHLSREFTSYQLKAIAGFKSGFSIQLFQSLLSWGNKNLYINKIEYTTDELRELFELDPDDYMRERPDPDYPGQTIKVLHRYNFEKYTIMKAVEEINEHPEKSGMKVEWKKLKRKRTIIYEFSYIRVDSEGRTIWKGFEENK